MSNPKHSAGPWKRCTGSHKDSCICGLIYGADGETAIATVFAELCPFEDHDGVRTPISEVSKANARLVEASPDLLAACKTLVATLEAEYRMACENDEGVLDENAANNLISNHRALVAARAAILAAEGVAS